MHTVSNIRETFRDLYYREEFTENGMLEIIGSSFIANEPAIFGKPNTDYIRRELRWYCTGSLNINTIEEPIPAVWKSVANVNGEINSNYGWCVYSPKNNNQLVNAYNALINDKNTRQAIMIYTRPTMHQDAIADGKHDFMCTNTVQCLIRNNHLHLVVNMRSNDAIYGYKNDYAWHRHIQSELVEMLFSTYPDINPGYIYWQTGSLHIYPKHFYLLEN